MRSVSEIMADLHDLSDTDRKRLLAALMAELGDQLPQLVTHTSGVCGGEAHLVRTRIPVWTLERMRSFGLDDQAILEAYPSLTPADLRAAQLYTDTHRTEIDRAIRDND
jgi:uncharacterized protein (DUF433 family)